MVVSGSLNQRHWVDTTTGKPRYKVEVNAEMVSASLRFATTEIHKTSFGRMDAPAKLGVSPETVPEEAPALEEAPF